MENFASLVLLSRADSFGSIIIRGIIWITLVIIIAVGIDNNKERLGIKSDVGWFLFIIVSIGLLSVFLFGFVPTF